jgi:hypothetical protein
MFREIVLCGVPLLAVLVGCSDPGSGAGDSVPVEGFAEPLSNTEHCDSTGHDRWVSPPMNQVATGANYDHAQCRKAYIADFQVQQEQWGFVWGWAGAIPNNPTDCARAKLLSYVYEEFDPDNPSSGGSSYATDLSVGTWVAPSTCEIAPLTYTGTATAKSTFRFAVSARQVAANGSYNTVPLWITAGVAPP